MIFGAQSSRCVRKLVAGQRDEETIAKDAQEARTLFSEGRLCRLLPNAPFCPLRAAAWTPDADACKEHGHERSFPDLA